MVVIIKNVAKGANINNSRNVPVTDVVSSAELGNKDSDSLACGIGALRALLNKRQAAALFQGFKARVLLEGVSPRSSEIERRAKAAQTTSDGAICVDYLQRVSPPAERFDRRDQEVSAIGRRLKML